MLNILTFSPPRRGNRQCDASTRRSSVAPLWKPAPPPPPPSTLHTRNKAQALIYHHRLAGHHACSDRQTPPRGAILGPLSSLRANRRFGSRITIHMLGVSTCALSPLLYCLYSRLSHGLCESEVCPPSHGRVGRRTWGMRK